MAQNTLYLRRANLFLNQVILRTQLGQMQILIFTHCQRGGKSAMKGLSALFCAKDRELQTQGPKPCEDNLRFLVTLCKDVLFNCIFPCCLAFIYLLGAPASEP